MIKLYGFGPTRSLRAKWALDELTVPYEFIDARTLIRTTEYQAKHPLGKMPALEVEGRFLFESVAIVNYVAERFAPGKLIAAAGTWERALQDQWSAFALAELEAWVWSNAKHAFLLPEEKRSPGVIATNSEEFRKSAAVLNNVLKDSEYLVGSQFSVADINAAYSLNWGQCMGLTHDLPHVGAYLNRLHERPRSPLKEQTDFFKQLAAQ